MLCALGEVCKEIDESGECLPLIMLTLPDYLMLQAKVLIASSLPGLTLPCLSYLMW